MKPNKTSENSTVDWLEQALRRFPNPEVPVRLKDRLIGTIPVSSRPSRANSVTSSIRLQRLYMAIAACVAFVCFGLVWSNRKRDVSSVDPMQSAFYVSDFNDPKKTIEIHFEGETDPCNILEPLCY